MGTLLDLIASLAPAPAVTTTAAPLADVARAPAVNDVPVAPEPSPATTAAESAPETTREPQPFIRTAATAKPEWREARDQYHNHIFACRGCHPPTGRHCQTGAELRARYDATPWS